MKKFIKISSIIITISLLFCLSGCGKSETEYKSAMSEHMIKEHGVSINSYESFTISDNGGASGILNVTAQLADMDGTIEMNAEVSVDDECNVIYCSWCDFGF